MACYVAFILRSAFRVEGRLTFTLFDDAMISLTYPRNLSEGHGLVWIPGGPPVEGYTNFAAAALRPDVIALGWRISAEERRRISGWGYEKVAQYWVRREADVDRRELRAPWR